METRFYLFQYITSGQLAFTGQQKRHQNHKHPVVHPENRQPGYQHHNLSILHISDGSDIWWPWSGSVPGGGSRVLAAVRGETISQNWFPCRYILTPTYVDLNCCYRLFQLSFFLKNIVFKYFMTTEMWTQCLPLVTHLWSERRTDGLIAHYWLWELFIFHLVH